MIREMKDTDVKAVAKLEEYFSRPWSEESLKKEVGNPGSLFLVAEEENKIVGYMGMYLVADEADVTNIVVEESSRGKGYGRKILMTSLDTVFSRGYQAMTLEVRSGNQAAIRLYQSLGFQVEGVRRNFYDRPREDALIMWKRK